MPEKLKRDNGPELLRCIAMFLIVLSHFATHGTANIYEASNGIQLSQMYLQILSVFGNFGNCIFFMFSGWYSFRSTFKHRKVFAIVGECFLYSVVFFFMFDGKLSLLALQRFMPLAFHEWWFITAYFGLYVFSPWLKKLMETMDNNSHLKLIGLLYLIGVFIPFLTNGQFLYSDFIFAVDMYMLGGVFATVWSPIKTREKNKGNFNIRFYPAGFNCRCIALLRPLFSDTTGTCYLFQ